MVDGISLPPSVPSVNKQNNVSDSSKPRASESSDTAVSRESDAVVVDVSNDAPAQNPIENEVAAANLAAAGQEAPTTQELATALNADTVAVALGNTVDIKS